METRYTSSISRPTLVGNAVLLPEDKSFVHVGNSIIVVVETDYEANYRFVSWYFFKANGEIVWNAISDEDKLLIMEIVIKNSKSHGDWFPFYNDDVIPWDFDDPLWVLTILSTLDNS